MHLLKSFLSEELKIPGNNIYSMFLKYDKFLLDWNKKVNLISRKMPSIESNVLTSIFFLAKYDIHKCNRIVDIGTGGGFPGVPLAILYPEIKFTLIDSIRKKINALSDIIINLSLKNIECICGRAEEVSNMKSHNKKYDTVISKSVSTLSNLYNWGKNYVNKNGPILCIKGGDLGKELIELGKVKNIQFEVINYDFDKLYCIENKKLVIIKPLNLGI